MKDSPVVVDSSAIIAILRNEPEKADLIAVLSQNSSNFCSMVTFVESFMVSTNRNQDTPVDLHLGLLAELGIKTIGLDQDQALLAAQAFLRFGKGRHPAKLNLGDCFSYALAKSLNAPLLFKGDDFSQTDIVPAIAAGAAGP
ncbi:type II toxin-antitoxin system VapC family toxin [Bosea caraganae]|uniref:Ribonuclease VapC n=1 Tax=Bosea caraganae TaxID=2763117 RepID=A0A370L5H8_9HYPH|nr:type II toxin-antitoxin system VapC family toxin [Bosea caraganae]RDJ23671.1 type II toxin-antitoxin system VapC family toxin [Bosea caraganae]RDJ24487.1 type II toxin-antitoxin system VapC family toxin [Bosea caraganae]